jgi:hypothetical protein
MQKGFSTGLERVPQLELETSTSWPEIRLIRRRMTAMSHELRHAARRLMRSPAFTLTTVLTLALAVGANASIFSIVERVILNPLPYRDSDRLVEVDHGAATINLPFGMGITLGLYHHYAERARTLDGIAAYRAEDMTLTGDGEPERVRVARTTTSLAAVLRVAPAVGRWFLESEASPGAERVAVMSHRLWLRRYSASSSIIGRSLDIAGVRTTVVGIMPASYAFPDTLVELWIPEQATKAAHGPQLPATSHRRSGLRS